MDQYIITRSDEVASFTFDIPPESEADRQQEALLRFAASVRDKLRRDREERERLEARPKSRVITLRMPTELVERLDQVAAEAGTNRGHLLRQISSDFLNYVWANGIQYRGSLLSFKYRADGEDRRYEDD
jgi:predicted DNA binding CopG/RHH family protein